MGDDISSGSVCFDFGATNVMHLSMLSIVAPNELEPEPMSSPINYCNCHDDWGSAKKLTKIAK